MALDVSVIVPFFNPGANIEDCLASLVAQTMPSAAFEVILIDDGSTDGSAVRVKRWVSDHPDLMSVHHIAASGSPGRPRNIGVQLAAGRFIQFLDSDDTLAPRALERMVEVADSSDADVVVGKLSSDFRGIYHPLFRDTVTHRTLDDFPLVQNLTVCKMFRREFLAAHEVRFPEGPHYIEDQYFCMQAYVHARSVAVVGDTACYFYRRRRTGGGHRGASTIVPADYFAELEQIFDLIDTYVSKAATRRKVMSRFYRNEMLGRLRGPAMLAYDEEYRLELIRHIQRLATTRTPPDVHEALPAFYRAQSRLLLADDIDGLLNFARQLEMISLRASTTRPTWRNGRLVLDVDASLWLADDPLRLERDDDGWLLPQAIAPGVPAADRRLGANDDADLDLDLATMSRIDSQLWSTTAGLTLTIEADGTVRVAGEVEVDPSSVMGGQPLHPGLWGLRLRVIIAGLSRTASLQTLPDGLATEAAWLDPDSDVRSVAARWPGGSSTVTLDVDQWTRSLQDIVADQLSSDGGGTLAVSGLQGPSHDGPPATLIFTPIDSPDVGIVTSQAALQVRPTGTTIEIELPDLPRPAGGWAVWLRVGDIGAAPPRQLPVVVRRASSGELSVEARVCES